MSKRHPEVLWIFRMPMPAFFSIEKVFGTVLPFIKNYSISQISASTRAVSLKDLIRNCSQIRSVKADLYHITGEIHYVALVLPRNKTILTIHDCVFLQHPHLLRRFLLKLLWLKWPVNRAAIVTTISEKSKKDIIRHSGCNPEKVIVIPNPGDLSYTFRPKPFNKAKPVLLQVGVKDNKNLERVFEAISGISCVLEIIGKLTPHHLSLLQRFRIDYRNQNLISEDELRQAYYNSDMLIFVSYYEGFGLPVIEAQATGRAVVTSNIEPMNTISGGGACLVDPFDVNSIREGILKVINEEKYREELIEKGRDNVKQFHPARIAAAYEEIYNQLYADQDKTPVLSDL